MMVMRAEPGPLSPNLFLSLPLSLFLTHLKLHRPEAPGREVHRLPPLVVLRLGRRWVVKPLLDSSSPQSFNSVHPFVLRRPAVLLVPREQLGGAGRRARGAHLVVLGRGEGGGTQRGGGGAGVGLDSLLHGQGELVGVPHLADEGGRGGRGMGRGRREGGRRRGEAERGWRKAGRDRCDQFSLVVGSVVVGPVGGRRERERGRPCNCRAGRRAGAGVERTIVDGACHTVESGMELAFGGRGFIRRKRGSRGSRGRRGRRRRRRRRGRRWTRI